MGETLPSCAMPSGRDTQEQLLPKRRLAPRSFPNPSTSSSSGLGSWCDGNSRCRRLSTKPTCAKILTEWKSQLLRAYQRRTLAADAPLACARTARRSCWRSRVGAESAEAWRTVLDDLITRGLSRPELLRRRRAGAREGDCRRLGRCAGPAGLQASQSPRARARAPA